MAFAVIGETQQRPNPVAIWCQDSTGAYAPCQSGPTAAASADNVANQTTSFIHGFGFMFDGSTWDRVRGDSTDGLLVNLGTNNDVTITSGTVAATQSGTWNIGTVTTLPALPSNQSVNVAQMNGVATTMGNGVSGTGVQRVTIASDSTGQITANAGTNLNTSALLTTTAHDAAFGTAGSADTQVRTVQGIASMTPLLVNPGTAANFGVYAEDAAETAGGNLQMAGTVRRDTAASSAGTSGDNATLNTDGLGRVWTRDGGVCSDHARITHAAINESTAATNEIVALTASNLIYVCSYKWVTTAANSLSWSYGTGTDCATGTTAIEGPQPYAANGGVTESGGGAPLFVVPSGQALCLVSSAATAHGGRISYVKTAAP